MRLVLPTESPALLPTKLLLAETVPVVPPVPLIHVTAPKAFATVPPSPHSVDRTTKLPLERAVKPLLPTESPVALPTRLLVASIVPLTPVVPLPQVTAPLAFAAVPPLPQLAETTT